MKLITPLLVLATFASFATHAAPAASLQDALPKTTAAAAEWRPMKGSLPLVVEAADGVSVIEGRCNFASAIIDRASWDRALNLDLSDARGIEFEVLCTDTTPISYFAIYFQSGDGWYTASFFPEKDGRWQKVKLEKEEFAQEGQPAGWEKLKTLRLSAWRGMDKNTSFQVRNLRPTGKLGLDTSVLVLRGDAGAARYPDQAASYREIADRVADQLRAVGIECATCGDTEVTPARLAGTKLLVLPHNSHLEEATTAAIIDYLRKGGKVLGFYSVPSALRPALNLAPGKTIKAASPEQFSAIQPGQNALPGVESAVRQSSLMISDTPAQAGKTRVLAQWLDKDGKPSGSAAILASTNCVFMTHVFNPADRIAGRQLLLSMAGALVPELWREKIKSDLREMAVVGSFEELGPLTNHIVKLAAGDKKTLAELDSALGHRNKALQLFDKAQFPDAQAEAAKASTGLMRAFCSVQKPLPGEFRGFWCHSGTGVKGMTWDQAIQRLAANGFTAIVPNMLWGGAAFHPSKFLPAAKAVQSEGDQVQECLDACKKHGIEMHVWKVNWYLGTHAPAEFVKKLESENRLMVSYEGKPHNWLCPSHLANQQLEIDSMVELARNYAIDGLHFDYIRYPGKEYCFCNGCRERFQKAASLTVKNWPADISTDSELGEKWNEWRRANITAVVKAVSKQARAVRPSIKISAAVFPSWNTDRNTIAQDWKVWCDNGYLDFVCPMDYTPSNRSFENMVVRQLEWAGKVPCYPGLGVSASRSKFGPDRAVEQILITRQHRTGGFMIFNYGVAEANDFVPMLGMGITAPANSAR